MQESSLIRAFNLILAAASPPELGPGPRAGALPESETRERCRAASGNRPVPPALEALALLWHDRHEAAHALVQDYDSGDPA